jgi:hypothetical protein
MCTYIAIYELYINNLIYLYKHFIWATYCVMYLHMYAVKYALQFLHCFSRKLFVIGEKREGLNFISVFQCKLVIFILNNSKLIFLT